MSEPSPKARRAGHHVEHVAPTPTFCPRCGHSAGVVWVHGHGQCAVCGSVIEDCCQGVPALPHPNDPDEGRG